MSETSVTNSAKEVIAAAIPEALDEITYVEDDDSFGVDGWVNPAKLSTAILAALEADGYVVVEKRTTAYCDDAMLNLARSAVAMGESRSFFVQTAEAMHDQAYDERAMIAAQEKQG